MAPPHHGPAVDRSARTWLARPVGVGSPDARLAVYLTWLLGGLLGVALAVDHGAAARAALLGARVTEVSPAGVLVGVGLPVATLAALARLAAALEHAFRRREQLKRYRVDLERERVARDLHDLTGRTLVTASLRTQALLRTLGPGHPLLRARLQRLQNTLSAGQQRVRVVTSEPVATTWDDEVVISRSLCSRVGICFVVAEHDRLPVRHRALAGLVLREGVTAALRARRAVRVQAHLEPGPADTVVVRVVLDGPTYPPPEAPPRVVAAVAAAGGTVAVSAGSGRWSLDARLPRVPAARVLR